MHRGWRREGSKSPKPAITSRVLLTSKSDCSVTIQCYHSVFLQDSMPPKPRPFKMVSFYIDYYMIFAVMCIIKPKKTLHTKPNITKQFCFQATCKCHYKCREITQQQGSKLHDELWKQTYDVQGTFVMGLINIVNIQRRRNGNYNDPAASKRQVSCTYCLPSTSGHVQVCSRAFKDMLGLTDKRVYTLIEKKKKGDNVFKDHRGKHPKSHIHKAKYTEEDKQLIKAHIMSFPTEESHYSRHKSSKHYLSPDLNIHRMYRAFTLLYPDLKLITDFTEECF